MKTFFVAGNRITVDDDDYERVIALKWSVANPKEYPTYFKYFDGKNKSIRLHRFILGVTAPEILVDHINRNTLDNRKCNLRLCTPSQSVLNRIPKKNSLGIPGVRQSPNSEKYQARISVNKKSIYLGTFDTAEEASGAYIAASLKYHGIFSPFYKQPTEGDWKERIVRPQNG